MSRNMLKNATPWLISGFAFLGQAMSSTRAVCSLGVAATNVLPNRSEHSLSSQASPPRIGTWPSGRSVIMKSMYSGTPASVALPERSSFGMTRSARTRTVSHSCGVKNAGANGPFIASRANCAARAASAGVHLNAAVSAARCDAIAILLARHVPPRRAAHLRDERAERLLHVLDLEVFVIGELPVEAEHGDAPFVHDSRIDFAVAAVIGNHLAAPGEPDVR